MTTPYIFPWDACKAEWPEQVHAIDQLVIAVCAKKGTRYEINELYEIMECDVFAAFPDIVSKFVKYRFLRQIVVSTVNGKEFGCITDMSTKDVAINSMDTIKIYYEVL